MRKPFIFTDSVALGAAGTGTITFAVSNGVDFVWCKGLYGSNNAAVQAGTDTVFGGALVTLEYTSGGNVLFQSKQAPVNHWFGTMGLGSGPLLAPTQFRFPNNSTIILNFADTAGGITLRVSMIGYTLNTNEPS